MPSVSIELRVPEHAESLFAVMSDPLLYQHVDLIHRPATAAALRERIERNASGKSPDGTQDWLAWVVRNEIDEVVGFVTATIHPNREADLAYGVASQHWGKGYARSAVEQLLPMLCRDYAVTRFCIVTERANVQSVALARRLGFAEVSVPDPAAVRHALGETEVLLQRIAEAA
jgi:RimJ/RimL family protein N-acetyltransferase